jgi:hypothetical protein
MPFPASVTPVTVTGRWRYADGSTGIPTGYVTFTPNSVLQVPADGDILPVRQVRATLDPQGAISVTLMSTADTSVEPTGWAYVVNEFIGGQERTYLAGFPAVAPGQTYDLSGIAPAVSDPVFTYVPLASVGTVGGPAGPLDGSGKIPSSQIPASGASVTSVNGHVGVVVLVAADVGADAAGAAAAAQAASQPLDADLTTIAGLAATTDNVIQSVGGAWASRTPAQLKTTLALAKSDVGLGNADNTSDANKPVSTAQAAADALNLKIASNLSDLNNASTARTNLGLGSAATQASTAFDAAGAAAAAQAASQPLDAGLTSFAALTGAGFVVATATDALTMRTLVAGSSAVVVANGTGAGGNPSVDLNTLLKAVGALAGNGLIAQTAAGTVANRSVVAADSSIVVTAGDGVSGNPSLSAKVYVDTGSFGAQVAVNTAGGSFGTNVSAGSPAPTAQNGPGLRTYLAGALLLAASQVFAANSVLATLPTAQRPAALCRFAARTIGSNTQSNIAIDTDGTIKNLSAITAGASGDTLPLDVANFVHA